MVTTSRPPSAIGAVYAGAKKTSGPSARTARRSCVCSHHVPVPPGTTLCRTPRIPATIGSGAGALPEVVGDAGFLVERDDAEAMTAAMHAVLTDAARTAQAVGRGVLRARRYSWDASAALLLDAYRQAMERRRSKTR